MRRIAHVLLVSWVAVLAPGCVGMTDRFRADGYWDRVYPYRVAYADAASQRLLDANWRLDNFVLDRNGRPVAEKTTDDYRTTMQLDVDGDGETDERLTMRLYELRLEHRNDNGVIWLRTLPLGVELQDKALSVLAHDYVEEVAGGSYFAVQLAGRRLVQDIRLATTIVEEGPAVVDGREGWGVTFDVANVDQLRLDPDSRSARVRVVLVHPGIAYPVSSGGGAGRLRTVMMVGYLNSPAEFPRHLEEFADFLGRIDLPPVQASPR